MYVMMSWHIVSCVSIKPTCGERLGYARCLKRMLRNFINVGRELLTKQIPRLYVR